MSPDSVVLVEADDLRQEDTSADVASEHLIADRLDALEAERVIHRALELEAESLTEPHVITTHQLERIANEVGVDLSFLHQAIGEVRLTGKDRTRLTRFILPDELVEMTTIQGMSRTDAEQAVETWMTNHEGLIRAGTIPGGIEWDINRRLGARLRARSLRGGNRVSRAVGGDISHRMHSISESEHVVAFESRGERPLLLAKLGVAAATVVMFILVLGAALTGLRDLLIAIPTVAVIGTAISAASVAAARRLAKGIRRALRRSLAGLDENAKPLKQSWFSRRRKKSAP